MKSLTVLSVFLLLTWVTDGEAECGYKKCRGSKPDMINVHLVPHSHDDAGWLKTYDQYMYGANNSIQHAGVQYILDSVIMELGKNEDRRFIQVESAFFCDWYYQQSADVQEKIKKLVQDGVLEFVGGGWSMNDEAAVNYQSVIDQFTVGLKCLNDIFGECGRPRVGWQIDPFGHSREMASLFAQMGYDGQFFARMDFAEKNLRLSNMTAEMIWRASDSLGADAELFTGLLFNHYSAPPGYCFDSLCHDDPIIDGKSRDNNVRKKIDNFIAYINNMIKYYRSTHLMVPMGDDFNYENANMNFRNMDKLIKYVNERQPLGSKVNVFYSTPSCYLEALHSSNLTWPDKHQDFFPYSTDQFTYWSGYFSSRPTQKKYERDGNHFLQVSKQLTALANLSTPEVQENLDQLRHAMGVMQHHDAITGTEKQHVANDYNRMLSEAMNAAAINTRLALQKLTNFTSGEFVHCWQLNISVCEFTQTLAENLVVTLFNPLSHPSTQYVRVPVKNDSYIVTDAAGKEIQHQIIVLPAGVLALTDLRNNLTQHELVFEAYVENKLANYYIKRGSKSKYNATTKEIKPLPVGDVVVKNSVVEITLDSNGILSKVQVNNVSENIMQQFYYYEAALGNNSEFRFRSSGAYIFRPNGTEVLISPSAIIKIYDGPLVKEVHQQFNEYVSQVIRLYEGKSTVEFEWLVGPIPIEDHTGKEIISRFNTPIESKSIFYTDSNGREMLKRVRNEREGFKPNLNETISGNYYPITSCLSLEDEKVRLALLNDRAQGGSSLKDGSLELMVHRRLLHDDAFGVGEALNEIVNGKGLVARGKHQLILNLVSNKPTIQERLASKELHLPYAKFFSLNTNSSKIIIPNLPDFAALPKGLEVLTLEPHGENEILLRLESEGDNITFNMRSIFDGLAGEEIYETTLGANMKLSDMNRFKFHADGSKQKKVEYYTPSYSPLHAKKTDDRNHFTITMRPMQIRTFIIIKKK